MAAACAHSTAADHDAARDPHEAPAPHLQHDAHAHTASAAAQASTTAQEPGLASVPTESGDVSLDALLAFADQHSPVLAVARSTRSRADAARVAASPALPANPQATLALGPRFDTGDSAVDVQATLMQQIQISGERSARLGAAERLHELTDAEIERMRWEVHCDVHAMFHRSVVEHERARLAQQVVAFQEEVLRAVERQVQAGDAAALTLRLAQAEVAQARQQLVQAEQTLRASRIRLAQLAGWPVTNPPSPSGGLDEPEDPLPNEQLVAVAMQHLPSLRAGAVAIREAEARTTLADREGWVQPSIGVQYTREGSPAGTRADAQDIVMGVLSVPIPSFQKNQGERAKARADVVVAQAELAARQSLLQGDIAAMSSEVAAAAQRARAYRAEILPRFEENLTLLRRSFELGEIDILALSVGRERFLRMQSDALSAHLDYFVAVAALERSVGVELRRDHQHEADVP